LHADPVAAADLVIRANLPGEIGDERERQRIRADAAIDQVSVLPIELSQRVVAPELADGFLVLLEFDGAF
jgi:hypothetical protein